MNYDTPRRLPARRGFSLTYQGKTLLSVIDPIGQAERAADEAPKADRTLYFCPSPLYGYGLERLLNGITRDSAVICVEIDEKLMEISRNSLDPPLWKDSRLRLARTSDPRSLCAFVRDSWGSRAFRRVVALNLGGGWRLAPETYDALAEALRADIAVDWGNAMTLVKLGRIYAANALRNMGRLSQANRLPPLDFGGAPTLVLGAGPSLDQLLPALKARFGDGAERPFRIIAVDTALGALKSWNIRPDLAVALESQHWNLRDFIGLGDWKLPLMMDLSALPGTMGISWDPIRFFFTPWTSLRLFRRLKEAGLLPETIPPLGSVGLAAAALAQRLCRGAIILGGLDFSYFPEAFHARDTPGHRERLLLHTRLTPLLNGKLAFRRGTQWAQAKNGGILRTDVTLRNYRNLFIREFAGDPRMRDITGSGLPLGIETVSVDQALDILASGDCDDGRKARDGALQAADLPIRPADSTGPSPQNAAMPASAAPGPSPQNMSIGDFIRQEQALLIKLRNLLSGDSPTADGPADLPEDGGSSATDGSTDLPDGGNQAAGALTGGVEGEGALDFLLDELDYLWAHFPECAGREGKRPPATDISFLKRTRLGIDPALALLSEALKDAEA